MSDLQDMIARWAQPGVVDWIGVRPARLARMQVLDRCEISRDGLRGDRGRAGKRAVTLIQAEHLQVIAACLGRDDLQPDLLRRNLVVRGLNLNGMKGRALRVGDAILRVTTMCAPCSLMERILGHGGYAAMRGHGGWCAQVETAGSVAVGQSVVPTD